MQSKVQGQRGGMLTLDVVQQDVLKEDDGVVGADGRLEQGLGVGDRGAGHQLHAWDALEVGLQALAVLSPQLPAHASRSPDHHRHLHSDTFAEYSPGYLSKSTGFAAPVCDKLAAIYAAKEQARCNVGQCGEYSVYETSQTSTGTKWRDLQSNGAALPWIQLRHAAGQQPLCLECWEKDLCRHRPIYLVMDTAKALE